MRAHQSYLALALLLVIHGCATGGRPSPDTLRSLADAGDATGSVPLLEMDITTKGFVEWYLSALGQAADELVDRAPSAEARKQAALLRFEQGTSAYAIAAGPNPYVQLMNLVALIHLEQIEWVEEGRAREVFGDHAPILEAVLSEADERAWRRADTYMTPQEVSHLRDVIYSWREQNPELRSLSFIRMADFAHELARSMTAFSEDRGILGRIAETNREIDEARLLGERAMYLAERSPLLLGWRVEAIVSDLMTHPDLEGVWEGLDDITATAVNLEARLGRLEEVLEGLPAEVIVTLSEETRLQEALTTVAAAGPVLEELTPAILSLEESLGRIAAIVDEIEGTYTPEFLRAEADRGARRLVQEARGLIFLATLCLAGLMVLFFLLRGLAGRLSEKG